MSGKKEQTAWRPCFTKVRNKKIKIRDGLGLERRADATVGALSDRMELILIYISIYMKDVAFTSRFIHQAQAELIFFSSSVQRSTK